MTESRATTEEFHDNHYRDAHEAYVRWLRHNPRGCVLNVKSGIEAVLHAKTDCMHIRDYSDPDVSLTRKAKLCSPSRTELEKEAKARGLRVDHCRTCAGG
jgi:hypothetical protein